MTGATQAEEKVGAGVKPASAPTPSLLARTLLLVVRLYQVGLSPLLGPRCRFEPTCSGYMAEALRVHGAWRGGLLGLWRLLRCHPFSRGGYDPVPADRCGAGREGLNPTASAAAKRPLHSNSPPDDTSNEVALSGLAAKGPREEQERGWKRRGG